MICWESEITIMEDKIEKIKERGDIDEKLI